MNTAWQKRMGLGLVALSGLFLCNPVVGFADVLPDFFGYLLLCVGLYRLADLNDCIAEASRRFRTLLYIGAGELLCMYIVHVIMQERVGEMNPYERPVSILMFSFVVLVLQWYFLIPALRDLFRGLDQLADKYDGGGLLTERRGKTHGERLAKLSTVFVILRSIFSVLPEASILTSFEHDAENALFPFDWYEFITLFRLVGGVLGTVIALIWLVSFLNYFRAALREREWIARVRDAYIAEILPQTGMLAIRRFSTVFLILNIAIVFTVNLRIDYYAALPGVVAAALTFFALYLLRDRLPERKGCNAACLLLGTVSLAQIIVNAWFLKDFLPEASLYQTDAHYRFLAVRVLDAAEAVATLIFVASLLKILFELVRTETAVEYTGGADAERLSYYATERLHREFEKRFVAIFVLFAAAAAVNLLDAFLQLKYGWLWLISFALSFAAIWLFYSMIYELTSEIKNRYQSKSVHKRE